MCNLPPMRKTTWHERRTLKLYCAIFYRHDRLDFNLSCILSTHTKFSVSFPWDSIVIQLDSKCTPFFSAESNRCFRATLFSVQSFIHKQYLNIVKVINKMMSLGRPCINYITAVPLLLFQCTIEQTSGFWTNRLLLYSI